MELYRRLLIVDLLSIFLEASIFEMLIYKDQTLCPDICFDCLAKRWIEPKDFPRSGFLLIDRTGGICIF